MRRISASIPIIITSVGAGTSVSIGKKDLFLGFLVAACANLTLVVLIELWNNV